MLLDLLSFSGQKNHTWREVKQVNWVIFVEACCVYGNSAMVMLLYKDSE